MTSPLLKCITSCILLCLLTATVYGQTHDKRSADKRSRNSNRTPLTSVTLDTLLSSQKTEDGYWGTVTDGEGNAIPEAIIEYNGQTISYTGDGFFYVDTIVNYRITIKSPGYEKHTAKIRSSDDLLIIMQKRSIPRMGVAFGLDMIRHPLAGKKTNYSYGTTPTESITDIGMGTGICLWAQPYYSSRASVAALLNLGIGWGIDPNDDYQTPYGYSYTDTRYRYLYNSLGTELTYGLKHFRLLGKYQFGYEWHNYESERVEDDYLIWRKTAGAIFSRQQVSTGFRFIAYKNMKYVESVMIDLYATFSIDHGNDNPPSGKRNWQYGTGIGFWTPGAFRTSFEVSVTNLYLNNAYGSYYTEKNVMLSLHIFYEFSWLMRKP